MHLIDTATATLDNQFTNGDPMLGEPATIVSDTWLNSVQAEIAAVIKAVAPTGLRVNAIHADPSNAGGATLTAATLVAGGLAGTYTLTCTVVAGAASTFSVVGPGGALADATQGSAYSHQISFTMHGTAPVLGDVFTVIVSALDVSNDAQLLAAIRGLTGGPVRTQLAFDVSKAGDQVPVKAWFSGATLFQSFENSPDPSFFFNISDQQVIGWKKVGIRNVSPNSITLTVTIVVAEDGANVFWDGASVASCHSSSGTPGTDTADIILAAGDAKVLDVLFYNRTSGSDNPGYVMFSAGNPFPAGLVLYDAGAF